MEPLESRQTTEDVSASMPSLDVVLEDEDIAYEEDIIRNENSLRSWQRYIDHKIKSKAPTKQVRIVFERALKLFNRSYKLWYNYLRYRRKIIVHKPPTDVAYAHLCDAYERCLVFLNKMPRIWIDYCQLQIRRGQVTETRRVFDRALRALPVTQHMRIWPLYVEFVTVRHNIPETAIRVYRRFLKMCPTAREDFVDYLRGCDKLDEAANQLAILVNEDKASSERGKTSHQLWTEMCELISKNPNKIFTLQVDPIIRQGIQRYTDEVGVLWLALAEYYIRTPNYEKARDIYEEALVSVKTVRDFTLVFDSYSKFMERMTSMKMTELANADPHKIKERELELELYMTRFEHLMDRRPLLLNSVLLRQNPHNVHEWLNRAEIYEGIPHKAETFNEAIKTVDPKHQVGKLSALWIAFVKFYEDLQQTEEAREVFEKAVLYPFARVEELADVWCEYVEFELRHSNYDAAVGLLKRATAPPAKRVGYFDETAKVQSRVHRSLKLWSLYADIEESRGTVESCKAVYEKILDLRVATPQIIINYALFLESNDYFEEAFKVYEKGIGLFRWPNVYDIWNIYLTKFISRYGGKKLERARDLFEQCLDKCPPKYAKNICLLYAKLEEEHGLARHAMEIYERATQSVDKEEMYPLFNIYIKKAMEFYGITKTRPIFQTAIERLPEDKSREMSLRFAQLERNLGEVDRARAIYAHCAEICDPRVHPQFWETWKEFEVKHGNEDTIREMLRIKRSVQATYNTNVNYMSAQMLATLGGKAEIAGELSAADSMAQLEARAHQMAQEEASAAKKLAAVPTDARISFVRGESKTMEANITENPEEIDIDEMGEEAAGEGEGQDEPMADG